MKNKIRKQYQRQLNKKIKMLNKSIENDPLWLGRFYAYQVDCHWYHFQDNSGGILTAFIRMVDKKTGKYKDYRLEYAPYYPTINWHITMDIANDFVVEYVDAKLNGEKTDWRKVARPDTSKCDYAFYGGNINVK